jgi:hypothetical protein
MYKMYKLNNKHIIRAVLLLLIIVVAAILGSRRIKLSEHYNESLDTVQKNFQDVKLSSYKGTKDDRAIAS